MMYSFRDTVESAESRTLPSEALRFNGEYLEDVIDGYRTLYVKGRETPEREVEYDEIGIADGGVYKSARYPPRTLTVGYQLIAADNTAFRLAYNKLLGKLHEEDAELIFRDETDKYYTGTMQAMGEIETGRNAVVGEIEFLCLDPFKRSVTEYAISPIDSNTFQFAYNGAVPVAPAFTVQFGNTSDDEEEEDTSSACGYVAFADSNQNTLQFGDLDEVDGSSTESATTLTNQTFTSYGTKVSARWVLNAAVLEDFSTLTQGGTLTTTEDETSSATKMLTLNSSGSSGSKWNGAGICRTLSSTASSFQLTYKQRMCTDASGSSSQRGIFVASVADEDDNVFASVIISKSKAGSSGYLYIYVNGERQLKKEIAMTRHNSHFGYKKSGGSNPKKTTTIVKDGSSWSFDVAGTQYACTIPDTADSAAAKVSFYIGKYKGYSRLGTNGLYSAKLESLGAGENTFSPGDVLEIDCETGEILLNDAENAGLGSVVNDWEEFRIQPGVNTVYIDYSSWAATPDCTLRYREVYL